MKMHSKPIVCGTDFSRNAVSAADVAAAFALRLNVSLVLLHVADEQDPARDTPGVRRTTRNRLRREAERLRAAGATVEEALLPGRDAGRVMVDYLTGHPAECVIVSSVSKTAFERWTVGSVSEYLAANAPAPTLVVRQPEPLLAWARDRNPLGVFIAMEFSRASEAALAWAARLSTAVPLRVTVGHVNWPLSQKSRVLDGTPVTKNVPETERHLSRELQKKVRSWLNDPEITVHIQPSLGRPDVPLIAAAAEAGADLIVAGTRQRKGLDRLMKPSTALGILRHAPTNVVCVPVPESIEHGIGQRVQIQRVLVATDFSPTGDCAVAWACAALPAGGVLKIVHVLPETSRSRAGASARTQRQLAADATRKLAALVPAHAQATGILTEIEVLTGSSPAAAIRAAARRFGPDILCLGSRGRGALAEALIGSVAREVVTGSPWPVLLVGEPPEEP